MGHNNEALHLVNLIIKTRLLIFFSFAHDASIIIMGEVCICMSGGWLNGQQNIGKIITITEH